MLIASVLFVVTVVPPVPVAPTPRPANAWVTEFTLKHPRPIVAFAVSDDRIATADAAARVILWDAGTGKEVQTLLREKAKAAPVTRMQFSRDGTWLFLVTHDGAQFHVCECRKPKQLQVFATRDTKQPGAIRGVTRGTPRWITSQRNALRFYHVATDARAPLGDVEDPFAIPSNGRLPLLTHIEGSDDRLVAIAGGVLHGWSADRERKAWNVTLLDIEPTALVLSPNSAWVAVAGDEGGVRLFSAANGQTGPQLRGHKVMVCSAAFNPDGRLLATASEDKTVRVWEVTTGKELSVLNGRTQAVTAVAFTSDGKRIVTGSSDNTVRIWKRT